MDTLSHPLNHIQKDALNAVQGAQRLVIKIGSALLVEGGKARTAWLDALMAELAARRQGDTLIVSSGAIRLGIGKLGYNPADLVLSQSQAAAAVGQIALAEAYQHAAGAHGLTIAQILLTQEDTEQRGRYLNARATIQELLAVGAIPLVNENDTVATAEIRVGDNDRLAARVAALVGADCLLILSDIDGLYSANPKTNAAARHIPRVPQLDQGIMNMAGQHDDKLSKGGMVTKLAAAQIALAAGTSMVLMDGRAPNPLGRLDNGALATLFPSSTAPSPARKAWIVGTLAPQGQVHVDAGAATALAKGASLLPVGVTALNGDFERGAAVRILGPEGTELARGLIAYSAEEAQKILGLHLDEIEGRLGYIRTKALIHANDLALF